MNKMKPLFLALIMLTASLAGCLGGEDESLSDDDGDGVMNENDECPNTPLNTIVDQENGCVDETQLDDDQDGVINVIDRCPLTPAGETADADGCSQSQIDDDEDGVMNNLDLCPLTSAGETVGLSKAALAKATLSFLSDRWKGISSSIDVSIPDNILLVKGGICLCIT